MRAKDTIISQSTSPAVLLLISLGLLYCLFTVKGMDGEGLFNPVMLTILSAMSLIAFAFSLIGWSPNSISLTSIMAGIDSAILIKMFLHPLFNLSFQGKFDCGPSHFIVIAILAVILFIFSKKLMGLLLLCIGIITLSVSIINF